MSHIVEVRLVYRVRKAGTNETAERAVKRHLFQTEHTSPWHDESGDVAVHKLSQRTVVSAEDTPFSWMEDDDD